MYTDEFRSILILGTTICFKCVNTISFKCIPFIYYGYLLLYPSSLAKLTICLIILKRITFFFFQIQVYDLLLISPSV